ncbi:MAG: hypothetical protein A2015_10645 [Spirochaetes bacterium GWF1_31_7]|nr:MAG: hypothetical protein A2Y29_00120 [Spirochaetes bacterium GWE2_31_10]OHD48159.1 MAG: hypothetical protein A2015_10645 [Spirochaetes bacterium GWF1_31_7]OHD83244.1 MAG: hypothetical protein A2355_06140 [Spirochaetes bacterium RIFOXYB1_FULL_32_8]HBD93501.1 N-acetyltransferase [Spirochaetia bacterium]HBI37060.1 N-acetyltransferase [Spirochaetia bacterium]
MNLLTFSIETKRLILQPANIKYAEDIFRNFNSEITTFMYPKPAEKIEETIQFIENSIQEMEKGENYQLIINKKETNEFIGCIGLHNLTDEIPELGIWIKKEAFGNKYGFEAIKELTNWAVRQKKWQKLKYPVDKRNISSRRIPERLNGVIVKDFKSINMAGSELDQVEYEISLIKEFI